MDAGVAQGDMEAPEMATPEQRAELDALIGDTRQAIGDFNASQFAMGNQNRAAAGEELQNFFAQMQAAGVDLNDPKSVAKFIQDLRNVNPELAETFEAQATAMLSAADNNEEQNEAIPPEIRTDIGS